MLELMSFINEAQNIYYVVLNPDDNSVIHMSKSLQELTGDSNYQSKQLREIVGCLAESSCSNSAVNLEMKGRDKVLHIVDCASLVQQFFVLKFKTIIDEKDVHVMVFTDTGNFSSNTKIINNLDSIFNHELINIMNNIKLINCNLADSIDEPEPAPDDLKELLEMSDSSLDVMEQVLKLYKEVKVNILDANYCSCDTVKLCQLVGETIKEHSALIKKKNLNVAVQTDNNECPDNCSGIKLNEGLLNLLFSNLINNAFKYAPEESDISISFEHQKEYIISRIVNRGSLNKNLQENFFCKFTKGENSSGTGFGTYCSKLITELFKGEIKMQNTDGMVEISVKLPTNL